MARQHRINGSGGLRSANALRPKCAASPRRTDAAGAGGATARRGILRPYATAGVALVGASLVAVTPVAAPPTERQTLREVELTAGGLSDLVQPWQDMFNTTSANASVLLDNYFIAPGLAMQQFMVNQADFAQQLLDDPASLPAVTAQLQENLVAVLTGYSLSDPSTQVLNSVINHTLSPADGDDVTGHYQIFSLLPSYMPPDQADMVIPILNFLASPLSGIIIGSLGPAISPWVALMNSITDGDGLNEILANTVGAYFNGATLDLGSLLPLINDSGYLPGGMGLAHLDFAFGGLLTPGVVAVGPYGVDGTDVPAVGGSIFNSVGLDMTGVPFAGHFPIESHAVGPIGAWMGWGQTLASLLGWITVAPAPGWDGKGPIDVGPPGVDLSLPTIPDDLLDDGGASALATDAASWFQDLLGAF